ncbi:hypothetical protein L0128_04390 [candidate division KSB1 bacterium]|nr:hypothetical protein [candidate division KSB1 bacterium]
MKILQTLNLIWIWIDRNWFNHRTLIHLSDAILNQRVTLPTRQHLFTTCFVRNEKIDNRLDPDEFPPLKIIAVNDHEIQLNGALKELPELYHPSGLEEKWGLIVTSRPETPPDPGITNFDYSDVVLIEGGDELTGALTYSTTKQYDYQKWIDQPVVLFNPFRNWQPLPQPLITQAVQPPWAKTYLAPAAMFQRRDGKYILLVNGENRTKFGADPQHKVGAFISDHPLDAPFKLLNPDVAIFRGSKRHGGRDSFQITSLLQSEEAGYWIGYGNARQDKFWQVVAVKFREDFKVIEYFDNLVQPMPATKTGIYFPTVIRYQNAYRMMWVNRRDEHVQNWEFYEGISNHELGPFDYRRVRSNPVFPPVTQNKGSFRSSHSTQTSYFMVEDQLYCLFDGTSQWRASGNRANRLFGLAQYDAGAEKWQEDPRNPLFINPMFGHQLWEEKWQWCADHLGGRPFFYQLADGRLMFIYSACFGADSYKVAAAVCKYQAPPSIAAV